MLLNILQPRVPQIVPPCTKRQSTDPSLLRSPRQGRDEVAVDDLLVVVDEVTALAVAFATAARILELRLWRHSCGGLTMMTASDISTDQRFLMGYLRTSGNTSAGRPYRK